MYSGFILADSRLPSSSESTHSNIKKACESPDICQLFEKRISGRCCHTERERENKRKPETWFEVDWFIVSCRVYWHVKHLEWCFKFFFWWFSDTHSQIMLLHSLKKANYNLPLVLTDSGVPPISNNTELKVQVCTCKKNRMDCSRAGSIQTNLLLLLGLVLLSILCKYPLWHSNAPLTHLIRMLEIRGDLLNVEF